MARIRSIKPDFWRSKQIAELPKATALFFIALWNFADDQGIVEDDSRTLSLQVPIYRSQDIQKMVNALWQAGLVLRSPGDGLLFITGWKHQKIDKPRDGKYKDKDINWVTWSDSTTSSDPSSTVRRKDRIGEDKRGKERKGSQKRKSSTSSSALVAPEKSLGSRIFESYSEAYRRRYGIEPSRSAMVNRNCKDLGARLGEDAIEIVAWYVFHNRQFYVLKSHPLSLALYDAESLRTEWLTGRRITTIDAKQVEAKQHSADVWSKFMVPEKGGADEQP